MKPSTSSAVLVAALVLLPGFLAGQVTIQGRVIADASGVPVYKARVTVVNPSGRSIAEQETDHNGSFLFRVAGTGPHRLQTAAIGYTPVTAPPLWIEDFDWVGVEIRLAQRAVLLAPLEIVAAVSALSPVHDNLRHRLVRGVGTYITREEIERRRPMYVSDVLATLPGVTLEGSGRGNRRRIVVERSLPGCAAQVFLDGILANRGQGADFAIDDIVSPLDIEAIEVYRGLSTVPPEFYNPDSRCGVIAIWTRR